MKKFYMKPTMKMVEMSNDAELLSGSPYDATPPNEVPDYDDWFGSRSDSDDRFWNDDWNEEE